MGQQTSLSHCCCGPSIIGDDSNQTWDTSDNVPIARKRISPTRKGILHQPVSPKIQNRMAGRRRSPSLEFSATKQEASLQSKSGCVSCGSNQNKQSYGQSARQKGKPQIDSTATQIQCKYSIFMTDSWTISSEEFA